MHVRSIMTVPPARIRVEADLQHAAEIAALSGAGDLMVVDPEGRFVGVLSEGDILRAALPDLEEVEEAGGSLSDAFDLFVTKGRMLSDRPIRSLVVSDPIVLGPDAHVAEAAVILADRAYRRLPVVEEGKLLGTVSRADVCRAVVGTL